MIFILITDLKAQPGINSFHQQVCPPSTFNFRELFGLDADKQTNSRRYINRNLTLVTSILNTGKHRLKAVTISFKLIKTTK